MAQPLELTSENGGTQQEERDNTSILNYPLCMRKWMLIICIIFVVCPCFIITMNILWITPTLTLTDAPKTCHECAKTISRNNGDYMLKKSSITGRNHLQCDYVNSDGKILYDYTKGIKTKSQCVYGLSIGLSIAGVLMICSVCCFIWCMCTMMSGGYCDYDNDVYMISNILGYIRVSDIIFGACWPFIMCKYCITKCIPMICQCLEEEVKEYNIELEKYAV
jgi:hypothetical protein